MPHFDDDGSDPVAEALELAEEIAPEIASILFTHYPDAETLDTLRPGETELETVRAVNRAVAGLLAAEGVEILAQVADRAAFRRWLRDREDGPEARLGWIDRTRLLRGAAAHRLLGIPDPVEPAPPRFPPAPGPTADRLLALLEADDRDGFEDLAQAVIAAGRQDVLDLAIRKISRQYGEEAGEELLGDLLAVAEGAPLGPSGWADLVALPVALPTGRPPDAAALGDSLLQAGLLPEDLELRVLPGWRSPDALAGLAPLALRRVLLDLLAGAEPRDLPPGDTDELARQGFGLLLGLQIDWDIPVWERIAAAGGLPEAEEEDEAAAAESAARFDRWRGAAFGAGEGCVPLALVPASEAGAEIAAFLEEAGTEGAALEEIREFIAVARREAGNEEVVCRPEVVGDGLELLLYTASGRFLDGLTLSAAQLPARAEEMPRLIEGLVRLVRDTPGR
ncbi:hypothetical protein [Paracraurococcus lichenis]|uniref:DUF2066 domain-containing protein n=1 Tax=Paracraurococcus lichenis TaxID=3064888 RepID=A0ABT9DWP2_9PROT|nr:hypothetical protein [Paracraurococcus sp. LOR1-02]MDO9708314.1 hypothetical protein [Paracraurococcus sp. LOR1-02]